MPPNAVTKKYTLTMGENTYSSPAAVNESDARKLQSLIPSLSGQLERERPTVAFTADAAFASRVGVFHQFKRNNNGTIVTYWFCATATTLYQLTGFPAGSWSAVSAVGTLAAFPVFTNINNTLHMSDSVSNWIFDGTSWVTDGLAIPGAAPRFTTNAAPTAQNITSLSRTNGVLSIVLAGNLGTANGPPLPFVTIAGATLAGANGTFQMSGFTDQQHFTVLQPGQADGAQGATGTVVQLSFTVASNRYYWTTFSDQSATHPHESSSSPRSIGTGALTGQTVSVSPRAGTLTISSGSAAVVGIGTDFNAQDVGNVIFSPNIGGLQTPAIASVQDAQHLTLSANAGFNNGGAVFIIAPKRTTHYNLYASSSEEDKIGSFLSSFPITGTLTSGLSTLDQSPFLGTVGSYFQNVQRPLLNDPTLACTIMESHKNRIWRNLLTFPNFFTYTGNEEILAELAGTPSECVPGDDPHTVSPGQVNETSYPDQSAVITGIRKHGDNLFIGTETNIVPLYGSSLADFSLSENIAFAVGFAGRRASVSTPFGLAFLSYDLKVYLYPSQYSFGVESTTALVELGRPKRPEFENIDGADFANVHLIFYNWGRRNWLVLSYRRTDQTFATWVFDFEVKGWFQLQQGYTAIGVFEMTPGRKSLVGATTGNLVVVIDDLTGNFPVPGNATYPVGYFRSLIDFTEPGTNFVIRNIEFEKSNVNMEVDVTIWLDPVDPDNPGTGILIPVSLKKIGANVYSGRPTPATGSTCQRVLVEFAVAASSQNGFFRGMTVEGDKLPVSPVL